MVGGAADTAPGPAVLFAHRLSRTEPTGIDRYAFELGAALSRLAEAQPLLMTSTHERAQPEDWPAGLSIRRVPGPRRLVHASWSALHRPRLETLLRLRPRVVHSLSPVVPVPTDAPLVVTVHDLTPVERPHHFAPRERWLFRRAVAQAVARAAAIVTDSAAVADDVAGRLGYPRHRIAVVPLGVAPQFLSPPPASDLTAVLHRYGLEAGRYFLHVGMLTPRKNLVTAVRAFAVARGALGTEWKLVLAGPGGRASAEVAAEVARQGLGSQVVTTGFVPIGDLPALVAGATALVHPAVHEGFGMTPLEAMAAGTAVVASTAGAIPEVVGEAGLLVDPQDVDAWAGALSEVGGDDDLRRRLEDSGRTRAGAFTWEATARRTLAVYDAVTG